MGAIVFGSDRRKHRFASRLPLRELRSSAGAAEAVFLALFHAAIAGEEAGVAEGFFEARVVDLERSGDAQLAGAGLAGRAAAADANDDVHRLPPLGERERIKHLIALFFVGEIILQLAAVDRDLTIARTHADAGDSRLAATGAENFFRLNG